MSFKAWEWRQLGQRADAVLRLENRPHFRVGEGAVEDGHVVEPADVIQPEGQRALRLVPVERTLETGERALQFAIEVESAPAVLLARIRGMPANAPALRVSMARRVMCGVMG